ncbi:hypothetical protein J0X15_07385 [Roseibium sp. CAU 1637]|uniref:Uncharacterized protein n=1 Tax=Roseibium limicola TaxID=2816037 RepID=A0A939J4R8_9HYPH|nr:DUF6352 family protein [Roseibium limicola]MBO0345035.1 hypothetical protein [Roseibium limicola]
MPEFWKSAGYHLVTRNAHGWLDVTPDLIRAYLTRPEIHPVEESCDAEHALFEALMADPARPVSDADLASFADPDAVDNYRVMLAFRDHLLHHGTVEAAYAGLFQGAPISIPPVFLDQLVHLILRNILRHCNDPLRLRAAELFFREQSITFEGGRVMVADAEIVEQLSETGGLGGLGSLLRESGTPMREVSLDVLGEDNAALYWDRSDRFDTALDFRFTEPGPDAFARVLEAWVRHFTGVDCRIQPVMKIRDERWSWHVGLDSEATRLLNSLWQGAPMSDEEAMRLIALFRFDFLNKRDQRADIAGKPVWMALAVGPDNRLRMKPQNLLVNLPLAQAS